MTIIVAGDWRLVAQGVVLEAFGLTLGPLDSFWKWFGGLWMDLGSHCVHIGCHWTIFGSRLVTFGAPRLHFRRAWELLGSILRSLGVIFGASGDQADIEIPVKNLVFLLIFEGWRLADVVSGSLW